MCEMSCTLDNLYLQSGRKEILHTFCQIRANAPVHLAMNMQRWYLDRFG